MKASTSTNWILWIGCCLFFGVLPWPALSAPLDLLESTPRWVKVEFEVSPKHAPGQLDSVWSAPRDAFLEPNETGSLVRIRIPTKEIEAHLHTTGTQAIPGSFSEFVWTIDPQTGDVVTADLTGQVRQNISVGPFHTSATVEIRVEMSTANPAGFRPRKGVFGLETNSFCSPSPARPHCIAVPSRAYDPESGYVNAVGSVVASTTIVEIRAFSPMGEVRFSERGSEGAETAISGTSDANAVCSRGFVGPCWADLGGES